MKLKIHECAGQKMCVQCIMCVLQGNKNAKGIKLVIYIPYFLLFPCAACNLTHSFRPEVLVIRLRANLDQVGSIFHTYYVTLRVIVHEKSKHVASLS